MKASLFLSSAGLVSCLSLDSLHSHRFNQLQTRDGDSTKLLVIRDDLEPLLPSRLFSRGAASILKTAVKAAEPAAKAAAIPASKAASNSGDRSAASVKNKPALEPNNKSTPNLKSTTPAKPVGKEASQPKICKRGKKGGRPQGGNQSDQEDDGGCTEPLPQHLDGLKRQHSDEGDESNKKQEIKQSGASSPAARPPQKLDDVPHIEKDGYVPLHPGSYSQLQENHEDQSHHQQAGAAKIPADTTDKEFNRIKLNTAAHARENQENAKKNKQNLDTKAGDLTVNRNSIEGDPDRHLVTASTSANRKDKLAKDDPNKPEMKIQPELQAIIDKQQAARAQEEADAEAQAKGKGKGKKLDSSPATKVPDPTHGESSTHAGANRLLPQNLLEPKKDGEIRETSSLNIKPDPQKATVPQRSCPGCAVLNEEYGYTDKTPGAHTGTLKPARKEIQKERETKGAQAAKVKQSEIFDQLTRRHLLQDHLLERHVGLVKRALLRRAAKEFVIREATTLRRLEFATFF